MIYSARLRRDWVAEQLAAVPPAWAGRVGGRYAKQIEAARAIPAGTGRASEAERKANLWLAGMADRMRAIRVPLNLSDSELCNMARECAAACMDIAFKPGTVTDAGTLRRMMGDFVSRYGIEPPPKKVNTETGEVVGVTDAGAIRRMGDHLWWRRRLRVAQGRAIEREAISLGYVHRNREIYASTVTVTRRAQQKRRNADALTRTVAVNQFGDEFTLAELAARAVSNPRIRHGELMTRINGFEGVAKGLGHVGLFVTQTCPSRMHRKATDGERTFDNPKYDGTTPRKAQRYLCKAWARCRAALARIGAAVYGFRIAEPHHDGTPHWHMLLFVAAAMRDAVVEILAKYARQEDAGELATAKAQEARFKCVDIDWSRGSAAGYVAKYVSKNIDGGLYQVQGDFEGGDWSAVTPAHRVEAWASTWGIRQFQQIGGAPVGVWRELRRLRDGTELTDTVRAAAMAADVGDWAAYQKVMAGSSFLNRGPSRPVVSAWIEYKQGRVTVRSEKRQFNGVKREVNRVVSERPGRLVVHESKAWPVAVAYTRPGERLDETGQPAPAPETRYGEPAAKAVWGVRDCIKGSGFLTRVYRWEVKGACVSGKGEGAPSFEQVGSLSVARALDFEIGRESGPWTRVNNCTEEGIDGPGNEGFSAFGTGESGDGFGGGVDSADDGARLDQRNGRCAGRSLERGGRLEKGA